MKHNQDWSEVDLEAMPEDFIPATAYFPDRAAKPDYDTVYGTWETADEAVPVASQFRVAWRQMAAVTGFRTLYPALIPTGTNHVNGIITAAYTNENGTSEYTALAGTFMSSLLSDFLVRSVGTHLWPSLIERLPLYKNSELYGAAVENFLRLNCLTESYAPLWEDIAGEKWTPATPIRKAFDRQLAQVEIDVLVARSLGVAAEELCMIYRTQFPVMKRYDRENHFDAHGRLIPKHIVKADAAAGATGKLCSESRTWVHPQSGIDYTFDYPFKPIDREREFISAFRRLNS